ncbi:hypothetical protein [Nocardia lijiangensis]|uniref:hypothetical protein n=1 Tax=Nocardia lijiangensis TaxID=299618 RepID=UPI0008331623|nr:hypothetical protein [Nocardia lijiangensis]
MKPAIHAKKIALGVVAGGLIGAAASVPAAAAPVEYTPPPPVPVTPAFAATSPPGLLKVLPAPLACLVATGFGLSCAGIT